MGSDLLARNRVRMRWALALHSDSSQERGFSRMSQVVDSYES